MIAAALGVLLAAASWAGPVFGPAKEVAFDQRIGASLPLDAPMRAEDGSATTVGAALSGRPALWVPVYFHCPMLCPLSLEGLIKALRVIPLVPGRDFDVVVFSFDPKDSPAAAAKKRTELADGYRRGGGQDGFRVLTGPPESIARLCRALGFRYAPGKGGQFAHAPGAVVVTAEGKISRYFLGVDYPAQSVRLALVDASAGKLGRWTDQVLLLCFHYEESLAPYTHDVVLGLRLLAFATVLAIAGWVAWAIRAETPG